MLIECETRWYRFMATNGLTTVYQLHSGENVTKTLTPEQAYQERHNKCRFQYPRLEECDGP